VSYFSGGFVTWVSERSVDWFGSAGPAVFVTQYGAPLGFALLLAGLGAAWARRSGVNSVLARLGHWRP